MTVNNASEPALRVAIVGAGIVGLTLAVGLLEHGIDVTVYEQASALKEIGTGIGLIPTAVAAMEALSPTMTDGMRRVTFQSPYRVGMVNGATEEDLAKRTGDGLYDLRTPFRKGEILHTCARAALATELLGQVPPERVKLCKKVVDVLSRSETGPTMLVFSDGTTAVADAVVGCDGVKSRVRAVVVGESNPAARCQYAREVCYRTLVSGPKLRELLGPLAESTGIYIGPGVYLIIYPVGELANISVYVDHPTAPPPDTSHGRIASREDLVAALAVMGPNIRGIADLVPEQVSVWALHDLYDHPLASYAFGRVCLAGDAAHAATSHHGAGAGFGVEDAAVLCKLLARVGEHVAGSGGGGGGATARKEDMIKAAMEIYDEARRERSQWLVQSSRRQGLLMKCMVPEIGSDMEKIGVDVMGRTSMIQDWEVYAVLEETRRELDGRIAMKTGV